MDNETLDLTGIANVSDETLTIYSDKVEEKNKVLVLKNAKVNNGTLILKGANYKVVDDGTLIIE